MSLLTDFRQSVRRLLTALGAEADRSVYLSVFRVLLVCHLFKKILLQWSYIPMLFGEQSFIAHSDSAWIYPLDLQMIRAHIGVFFYLFMVLLILYAFGIGKQLTAFLVFVFVEIYQQLNPLILNGGDNLLKFLVLYMVLADSYRHLTLSPLRVSAYWRPLLNTVTNLAVYSIVFHLCVIYFLSGVHKVHADVWFNGVATYYTFISDRFCGTRYNPTLVQNGLFVLGTTYFTIAWECSFIFLIGDKRFRNGMLLSGIVLHLGIYVFMMIHDFEILFIMTYGFFYKDWEWKRLAAKLKSWFRGYLGFVR